MKVFRDNTCALEIARARDKLAAAHRLICEATSAMHQTGAAPFRRIAGRIRQITATDLEQDFADALRLDNVLTKRHDDPSSGPPYGNAFSRSWVRWLQGDTDREGAER